MYGRPFVGRVRSRIAGTMTFSLLRIVAEGTDNTAGAAPEHPPKPLVRPLVTDGCPGCGLPLLGFKPAPLGFKPRALRP
ncbi:hypothetical protein GCM10018775_51000 [Streptomyces umbrinus]|nr:hypothetical protein GCM10018775_51000 [Streptomyces umbrinus]